DELQLTSYFAASANIRSFSSTLVISLFSKILKILVFLKSIFVISHFFQLNLAKNKIPSVLLSFYMITFRPEGIYCEAGDFYIDPWLPVSKALITHGHADHARWGMKRYLCHEHTSPILRSRLSPDLHIEALPYGKEIRIHNVKVSFHPAGHILGSAQIRLEHKGKITVISGDYKTQDDGLSTPFEPLRCHEFVSESTFGLPIYNWLPTHELEKQMQEWVNYNQSIGKTSVFVGYSLGKAQRIMKALEGVGDLN